MTSWAHMLTEPAAAELTRRWNAPQTHSPSTQDGAS